MKKRTNTYMYNTVHFYNPTSLQALEYGGALSMGQLNVKVSI